MRWWNKGWHRQLGWCRWHGQLKRYKRWRSLGWSPVVTSCNKTPETTHQFSDPLFDQDFDEFMESLDNLEPFDDLEDWSDDVDLFMEAICQPPHMVNVLWQQTKLKKQMEKSEPHSDVHRKPKKNNPQLDWLCDHLSRFNRVAINKISPPQESNHSIFDKH